jgi:hypothetical protein
MPQLLQNCMLNACSVEWLVSTRCFMTRSVCTSPRTADSLRRHLAGFKGRGTRCSHKSNPQQVHNACLPHWWCSPALRWCCIDNCTAADQQQWHQQHHAGCTPLAAVCMFPMANLQQDEQCTTTQRQQHHTYGSDHCLALTPSRMVPIPTTDSHNQKVCA